MHVIPLLFNTRLKDGAQHLPQDEHGGADRVLQLLARDCNVAFQKLILHLDSNLVERQIYMGTVKEEVESMPRYSIPPPVLENVEDFPVTVSVLLLKATIVNVMVLCRRTTVDPGDATLAALEMAMFTLLLRLCRVGQFLGGTLADRPAALAAASVSSAGGVVGLLF